MTTKRDYPKLLENAKKVIGDLSDGETYLKFVRSLPCLVCLKKPDPHHIKTRGAGGSDFLAVNLCRKHHGEIEQIGILRFERKHGINIEKVIKGLHGIYRGDLTTNYTNYTN